ncbi:MAG: class I SAM-dependent methyltransferase [Gemmatimonadota bacterium]
MTDGVERYRARARGVAAQAQGSRVLDVGCGTGGFLAALGELGWEGIGIERSPDAVRAARAKGLTVQECTLDDARIEQHSFDLVTMLHVLEHLPDPASALERISGALRRGGTLWVEVPNREAWAAGVWPPAQRHVFDLPHHLHHFSASSLQRLLRETGYVGVDVTVSVPPLLLGLVDGAARARRALLSSRRAAPPTSGSGPEMRRPAQASAPGSGARTLNAIRRTLPGWKLTARAVRSR